MNKSSKSPTKNTSTLFMGSPEYAAVILEYLASYGQNLIGVVTQPDKRVGRGRDLKSPPVKTLADRLGIPVFQPPSLKPDAFQETLENLRPELIIVAAYGRILREFILAYPEFGCVNVHASLLPRWRGASPVYAAIRHGDKETGVTIMKMDAGIDTGDIISQRAISLNGKETRGELTNQLAVLGGELLVETLPEYLSGAVTPKKQDEALATYTGLLKKKDGLISFEQCAEEIERQVRAMDPWPTAFFEWDGKKIKVFKADVLSSKELAVGERGTINKFPCIGTISTDLMLRELQLPGKRRVNGKVFLNGARDW